MENNFLNILAFSNHSTTFSYIHPIFFFFLILTYLPQVETPAAHPITLE